MSIEAVGYSTDFNRADYRKNSIGVTTAGNTQVSSRDLFREAVQAFKDANQLTAQELKEEKDWRDMTDEEWDKMLEGVDKYIEAYKERLRQMQEMQNEAAQKAALEADSDMRATAASSAALNVAANGSGTTTVGISQTDTVTECASVEEDENKEKIWTITAFGEDGIVSTRCQNGRIIDRWEIKYTNPDDAKKVQDFFDRFDKDANLTFSGSKDFWEEFLKK